MRKFNKLLASSLVMSMALSMLPIHAGAAETSVYRDVPATASYSAAIEKLTEEGIMNGVGDGLFAPDQAVTRAQAITVLANMAKTTPVETDQYSDVAPDAWYAGYVGWATKNGIVQGDGQGHFLPDALVTSEHLNIMLSRYAALVGKDIYFYDTGASTVTRADLAQRLINFYVEEIADEDTPLSTILTQTKVVYRTRTEYVDRDVIKTIHANKAGYLVDEDNNYVDLTGNVVSVPVQAPDYMMPDPVEIEKPGQTVVVNEAMKDSSTTLPVRVQVTATGKAGCTADETAAEHAAHTSEGWVMGYEDRGVYTFKGINYATARRFENPKPAQYGNRGYSNLYSTNRNTPTLAMVRGASSPQAKTNTVYSDYFGFAYYMTPAGEDMFGRESDCLNLNVWTSSMDSNAKKPVLVFMHGGGTDSDSATGLEVYEGRDFAEHNDIVFVTVNARLGTLGYSRDFTAIGGGNNLAVRDMLLSLEWVKENIASFGGDPNNVTIAGQSGGGSKVGLLVASKYADENDLFQKVVLLSASAGGSGVSATQETRNAATRSWVNTIKSEGRGGLNENSTDAQVLSYLQSVRTDELSTALRGYSGSQTIDGYIFDANSSFGNSTQISARAAQYDYLIGNTWAEMVGRDSIEVIQSNRYDRALAYMSEAAKTELLEAMRQGTNGREWRGSLEEVKAAFDEVFPGHDFYDLRTLVNYSNGGFLRDNYYNSSMQASRGQYANNSEHKTYEYLMAYSFPYFGGTPVYHTGDLAFWFYSLGNVRYQIAGDEENAYKLADFAATALANFCKYGDPSTDEVQWLPHEWYEDENGQLVNNLHCMIVDQNNVTGSHLVDGDYGDELNYLMTMIAPVDPNAANRFPADVNLANVRVIWYGMTMDVRDGDIDYENRIWTGELPAGAYLVELVTNEDGSTSQKRITLVSAAAAANVEEEPAEEEEIIAPKEEVVAPEETETPVEDETPVEETEDENNDEDIPEQNGPENEGGVEQEPPVEMEEPEAGPELDQSQESPEDLAA